MSTEQLQEEQPKDPSIVEKKNYNPFFQNVNEKPYTQMSVGVNQNQMDMPIAEPTYQPHSVDSNENPYDMLGGDGGGSSSSQGSSRSTPPPFNPSMNDVSDKDKALGAQHMAKLLVDGYEQLHVFANKALQFPERKINKLVSDGEIDLSIQIPYEFDKTISAGEFIQEFNEQNKDALSVSKEFKKEVTPVLTRVLEKRGAGLTDEQYLGFLVGKDLVVKLVIVAQMRSTMNDVINVLKDATQARGATPPPPPPPRPTTTTPPPPTQPVYQDQIIDTNATDFNFQTNESVMNSSVQQMKVPKTGKERVIAQMQKEKKWKKDAESASTPSSYEEAMKARNNNGKRGRKKKTSDYIKMDEDEIAEAIILNESVNQPKKEKDPYADL